MRSLSWGICAFLALAVVASAQTTPSFDAPVRLKDAGGVVQVEAPGFAAPAWHDVDGDGRRDLVVGQFRGGKMKFHRNLGTEGFAAGTWILAEGKIAEVPDVW